DISFILLSFIACLLSYIIFVVMQKNLLLIILFLECSSINLNAQPIPTDCARINHSWQLSMIYSENSDTTLMNFPITFNQGYRLNLSVNQCNGAIQCFSNDSIKFENPVCTEKCCDSEDELGLIGLLTRMERMKIVKDTLILQAVLKDTLQYGFSKKIGLTKMILIRATEK
ncbi:MAG TPA: META domain-containing protein, partial [Bacteroidia bacterium]|nr:META domain-containing protein [Bacteroidia bacterium]